jgi:HD-GYP domain-containing protein (c-di-GMP phosphodiesterase class II)
MTSDRPYRKALTWESAVDEIAEQRGRHFDPEVVDAFGELSSTLHGICSGFERVAWLDRDGMEMTWVGQRGAGTL